MLTNVIKEQKKRVFTTKDGTTWDKFISYLKFDGT